MWNSPKLVATPEWKLGSKAERRSDNVALAQVAAINAELAAGL